MTRMADYIISDAAVRDLDDIWTYIAADNLNAANRVEEEILSAFQRLAENPKIGHIRKDLTSKAVRFWNVYSYMIVYRGDKQPIEIVRDLYAYRDIVTLI